MNDVNVGFKVYAALDFGTDGTGLAYCLPNGTVYIHNKWRRWNKKKQKKNDPDNLDDIAAIKPKTAILLDSDGKFSSFGDNALQVYMNMHDKTMLLFEHFKMKLYNKPHYGNGNPTDNNGSPFSDNDDDADDNDEKKIQIPSPYTNDNQQKKPPIVIHDNIKAFNGKFYPSSKVFIEAFKYLKKQAMHVFKRNKLQIKSGKEVCWILSIPAIWDDIAKAKMREWAIVAGMVDPNIKDQLLLRYEPDCASLSIQTEIMGKANKLNNNDNNDINDNDDAKIEPKLLENEIYILIDAGGGTVDVACHQVLAGCHVKELLHPSGGPWGDMHSDLYFEDIITEMFSVDWINEFKEEEPNSYLELLNNFRKSKWTFNDDNNNSDNEWHNVALPFEFTSFIMDKMVELQNNNDNDDDDDNDDEEIEHIIGKFTILGYKNCFGYTDGYLKIKKKIWKELLFDKLIDPTIDHCKTLLANDAMKDCKYCCVVGGFGGIKYFQKRIKKEFGPTSKYKLDIIIPERPILSVLDGAARMALQKNYVKTRVLAKTYGDRLANNRFTVYAHKNQAIDTDKPIIKTYQRMSTNQKAMGFAIYSTDEDDPDRFDPKRCSLLIKDKLPFPSYTNELSAKFEINFADTTISVFGQVANGIGPRKELKWKVQWKNQ